MERKSWFLFWAVAAVFLAVAQSESSPTPPMEYEVFLSFRGPDVRTNFADSLYAFLDRYNIRTFRDNEELPKGKNLSPSLVKAIDESKVYIPILSPTYAWSKWCLEELSWMLKCCKQGNGRIILPIFFMVEPRDVRHQTGPYKEAFQQQAEKYDAETVDEWKLALREVGEMKGWHVTESDGQGAIIDEVVAKAWSHLAQSYTLVTDELIGIDSHVEEVTKLLNLGGEGVKIIGIYGMGGIGKTTIAKAVYNKVHAQLDRYCFVEDVREVLVGQDGVMNLQNKIISDILRTKYEVKDSSDGINIIRERVCKRKVLIVLDDVDDRFEFDQILGSLDDFSSESRIIITTRNKRVLEVLQESKSYVPGEMSWDHALQLFSKHAFRTDNPPKEEATISKEFVKVATGLPLALKVIGSLLFRRERKFWEAKLIELKDIPPTKVLERLKISYNELSYTSRQIFLDIACCFVGKEKEFPFYMWSDYNFYPESGISTLLDRSLIKLKEGNKFWMHDHIKDLGKAIVREEDIQRPWKRTRICSKEDALDMVERGEGSDQVEVLRIDHLLDYSDGDEYLTNTTATRRLELTDKNFKKLSGLRYLEVRNGRLIGDFKRILPNLRWLRLDRCGSIPSDLNVKRLVILEIHDSPVDDDWKGWSGIEAAACKLKALHLSARVKYNTYPHVSVCGSPKFRNIGSCESLRGELHIDNFKNLKALRQIDANVTKLIDNIAILRKNLHEKEAPQLTELADGLRWVHSFGILKLRSLELLSLVTEALFFERLSFPLSQTADLPELKDPEGLSPERFDQLGYVADIEYNPGDPECYLTVRLYGWRRWIRTSRKQFGRPRPQVAAPALLRILFYGNRWSTILKYNTGATSASEAPP